MRSLVLFRNGVRQALTSRPSTVSARRASTKAGGDSPGGSSTDRAAALVYGHRRSMLAIELGTLVGSGYLYYLLSTSEVHRAKLESRAPWLMSFLSPYLALAPWYEDTPVDDHIERKER